MITTDPTFPDWLIGPCGEYYLHLEEVEWLDGPEDHDGVAMVLKDHTATVQAAKRSEIPGRRDCLYLTFSCETCGIKHRLKMMQHKGNTEVDWIV